MGRYSKCTKALEIALKELNKPNYLMPEETRFNSVLRECVRILKDNKYFVKRIPKIVDDVRDIRGLVALFFNRLQYYHQDVVQYRDEKSDLKIAKFFVAKLIELTGFKKELALGLAAELVNIVFEYEKEFAFEPGSLYSFRIFGQNNMSWVTEKALRIYNREYHNIERLVVTADNKTKDYEKNHNITFGFGSATEIQKLIDVL